MPRSSDLAAAFGAHWNRHFAPPRGAAVVVAVSGGLDSMALLALLGRDGVGGDLDVIAAHFDHRTRGAQSAEDGRFVRAVARRWGARARLGSGDAPRRAARTGGGPMAAARELRYRFLRKIAREEGAAAIATAHHRDDLVETVILRVARGTSPDGLGALTPLDATDGVPLFRPLLPFTRAAIAAWAEAAAVPFREDPSNADPRYPRTRVRRNVAPLMAELNPRYDEAIVRLAGLAAADAAYLGEAAEGALARASVRRDRAAWSLRAAALASEPDPVLSRALLRGWSWTAPPGSAPPNAEWVEGALAFVRGGRGGRVPCPGGGVIARKGPEIILRRPAPSRRAR